VVLSIATGHDVGYLTNAVAGGREGYYTGAVAAGEPPGVWYGAGAEALGLAGEIDAERMEAVFTHLLDPRDPASHDRVTWGQAARLGSPPQNYRSTDERYAELLKAEPGAGPERRAELRARAERATRSPVLFLDLTFSAPKSVTVLGVAFERAENDARAAGDHGSAAAWAAHRRAVEEAMLAGSRAALDYLQDVAGYARTGYHGGGAGRWVDAHAWTVGQFLQHDSRDHDPQLHVHNAVLNRVRCADGSWRTLDSRAIHRHRGAAGAIGERVMEAHLARTLGVRFATRPDGKAREVLGVSQKVMDLFSSRRRAITGKVATLVAAFEARFGRAPSGLERAKIALQATLATRAAKSHDGESVAQRLDRWEAEARTELAGGLAEVARTVLAIAQRSGPAEQWSPQDVVERALASVGAGKQAWTCSDLLRAVSDALPGHLGTDPERVRDLLEGLTDLALVQAERLTPEQLAEELPAELRLECGRSVYAAPGADQFATRGQLAAERAMRAAAVRRGAVAFSEAEAQAVVARFAEAGRELSADQAAALRGVLSSGAMVEVLSAAAGTGKSFTVGALAEAWQDNQFAAHAPQRRVFGLATSQIATQVLAEEGVTARNIAAWLATQDRLATQRLQPGDADFRLRPGDLVVVDEAGMASTADLAAINARCEAAGAKLLLVGDPRQLAAVGAGGGMADIAAHGIRYELAEVRRFHAAWEREASLRLRDGDPAAVATYAKHGRIMDAGTAEQAEAAAGRAWLADTLAGKDSVLVVGSNEAAARVCAALRADLVRLGRVQETGVPLARQGTVAGMGDLVQARRNGWNLTGFEGNTQAPINRQTFRVTGVREDGGLVVTPTDAPEVALVLPRGYVAAHVELAYASTVHAAQGRTVDTAHAVIGPGTDAAGAYVGLSRGRECNTAWVTTRALAPDAETGQVRDVEPRSAAAVVQEVISGETEQQLSALETREKAAEEAASVRVNVNRLSTDLALATAGRTGTILDRLTAEEVLPEEQRQALAADEAYGTLERLLRQVELAGHDPAQVLEAAVSGRSLEGSRSPAQVLHHRIRTSLAGQLTPRVESFADLIPEGLTGEWGDRLSYLAGTADERRHELGQRAVAEPPAWALEALGEVPDDARGRAEWEHRAGWVAAYRELAGYEGADPLGPAPLAGQAEAHATWRAAHRELDLPEAGAEEAELSNGQLRARVRAMQREETWAPRYVADELEATTQEATRCRTDAQIWAARAEASQDPAEQEQLRAAAEEARRRADELDQQGALLDVADTARADWYAHTAVTRDAAERARVELAARDVDLDAEEDQTTAAEWLAAHEQAMREEDPHRHVSDESELIDAASRSDAEWAARTDSEKIAEAVETAPQDIRQTATRDATEDWDAPKRRRVPTTDETTAAVARAQAALAEIKARRAADAAREAEYARRDELNRWADQDRAEEAARQNSEQDTLTR
jgi:conjugative relaxase-like TrwC/TraI family protein